jgi:putative peptidoglycan lipid II flippase
MQIAEERVTRLPRFLSRLLATLGGRRALAAIGLVGITTLGVRVGSLLRELVVAREFGVGDALDKFVIAYLVPAFAIAVVAGSITAALVPTYIRVRERDGESSANDLAARVLVLAVAFLIAVTIVLALTTPLIVRGVASGFSPEKVRETERLMYVLLPLVAISGVCAVLTGVLNAGRRFAIAAATPVLTPLAVVACLLLFHHAWGIYSIAVGWVIGACAELTVLGVALRRRRLRLVWWSGWDHDLQTVARQYLPMVVGAVLMSSTLLIDQAMASTLGSGSVSALSYGSRLTALIVGLGAIAVGTVAMPYFSLMVARAEWSAVRAFLNGYLVLIFAAAIPLTVLICVFSQPLVKVFLERGAFSSADTALVADVQRYFAIQIPFYVAGILVVRLISSLRMNKILMWGCALNAGLNVILNYLLMRWLGIGGIALSTSIVYVIAFLFLYTLAMNRLTTMHSAAEFSISVTAVPTR